jgi:hypothetical protein
MFHVCVESFRGETIFLFQNLKKIKYVTYILLYSSVKFHFFAEAK